MELYRKRPAIIRAWKVPLPEEEPSEDLVQLVNDQNWEGDDEGILIDTPEGALLALPGDYIIQGVANEFYPCKHDIFEKTYDLVDHTKTSVIDEINASAHLMANIINSLKPGRRRAIALTKLEEASMWAVKTATVGDD